MNRDRVYLFRNGSWCWCDEYSLRHYGWLGKYKEIVLGQGWHDRDVSEMLVSYYAENAENIF